MKLRRVTVRFNGLRKPVHQITDRAKRYRANRKEVRPHPPKQCGFCGSKRNVGVGHVDGNEDHGEPENLMWTCKRCNAKHVVLLKKARLGKRIDQLNPRRRLAGSKRSQLAEYGAAIKVMRGEFEGDVASAIRTIRATPRFAPL